MLEVQEGEENVALIPGWVPLCPAAGRKETMADTKSIAVKAAQRRSQALGAEGRQLLPPTMKHSSLSLHSLGKTDDVRPPGLLACKRPPSPTLQHAASEDSLSSSTGEAPSRVVERHGNGPCPALQGQKKSLSKKREESLEAKRKRKSQSFEVTGQGVSLGGQELGVSGPPPCRVLKAGLLQRPQGTPSCAPLSMKRPPSEPNISLYQIPTQLPAHLALQPTQLSRPKMHVTGPRPMENHTPEQRLPVVGHLTPTIQHMGKATLPMAKVKLPPCQNLGECQQVAGWGGGGKQWGEGSPQPGQGGGWLSSLPLWLPLAGNGVPEDY